MVKKILNFPFYIFCFASFPVISLFAWNVSEIDISVIWRPLILANLLALIVFFIFSIFTRNSQKSGIMTSILIVSFFSFGLLFGFLRSTPVIGDTLGRFRYLVPFYLVIFLFAIYLIYFKLKDTNKVTSILNFVGIILIVLPVFQASTYLIRINQKPTEELIIGDSGLKPTKDSPLPDIYVIVLDAYMRQDRLLEDYGYDNSEFIQKLRELGFYVADCSRSNYAHTERSLTSTLNLNYIQSLEDYPSSPRMAESEDLVYKLEHNQTRRLLKILGYKFVAFDTGAKWSSISNADYYYKVPVTILNNNITEFEALLLENSIAIIFVGGQPTKFFEYIQGKDSDEIDYWPNHIESVRNILANLPKVPGLNGQKFIFAHIMKPHAPYVFFPNGSLLTDTRYFSIEGFGINQEFSHQGYDLQVEFINNKILPILEEIIHKSKTPPIILIEGDHGYFDTDRFANLMAFYGPPVMLEELYPTISPVNSFRTVFRTVFNADYPPLPDISYTENCEKGECVYQIAEELSVECKR
jgi:hypothetical protein